MSDDAIDQLMVARAAIDAALAALQPATPEPPPAAVAAPPAPSQGLRKPAAFFSTLRAGKMLGPVLSQDEVSGCEAILEACAGWPASWTAYALATAYHETAGTMQPIMERGGPAYFSRMYDIQGQRPAKARELGNMSPGDGARYAGRGYIQLTGRANYVRAGKMLGVDLAGSPDLAMRPDLAAKIMRRGMEEGWFTGLGLERYLPAKATESHFKNARRIINGTDRAADIAGQAMAFQSALAAGEWSR